MCSETNDLHRKACTQKKNERAKHKPKCKLFQFTPVKPLKFMYFYWKVAFSSPYTLVHTQRDTYILKYIFFPFLFKFFDHK